MNNRWNVEDIARLVDAAEKALARGELATLDSALEPFRGEPIVPGSRPLPAPRPLRTGTETERR